MKNTTHVIISNRHIHLNREACDILFGKGYELTVKRPMAPPIFAANETVTLKGPKGEISGVRVLGPLRSYTQVEILRVTTLCWALKRRYVFLGPRTWLR